MSTVSPEASVALAERVRSTGARMLDAPVSGSVPQVEAGTLTVPLPSATTADDMLAKAEEFGYGDRDVAALYEVLAR